MKEEVVVVNIIMCAQFDKVSKEVYLFNDEKCILKKSNAKMEDLEEDYEIEEKYEWYFKNEMGLKKMLHKSGISDYYGTEDLMMLGKYPIRGLNFYHTGIGLKKFKKNFRYHTEDKELLLCVEAGDRFSSKWIREEELKKFLYKGSEYKIPKGSKLVVEVGVVKTIVNESEKVYIGKYQISERGYLIIL